MKVYGEWRYSSTILDLGNIWRKEINFTLRPLYLSIELEVGEPQCMSRCCGESTQDHISEDSNNYGSSFVNLMTPY
jgi:hypothetical protein